MKRTHLVLTLSLIFASAALAEDKVPTLSLEEQTVLLKKQNEVLSLNVQFNALRDELNATKSAYDKANTELTDLVRQHEAKHEGFTLQPNLVFVPKKTDEAPSK